LEDQEANGRTMLRWILGRQFVRIVGGWQ